MTSEQHDWQRLADALNHLEESGAMVKFGDSLGTDPCLFAQASEFEVRVVDGRWEVTTTE